MSNVITNPISNIPINPKSHVHGWSQMWRDHLNAHIDHKCTPSILSCSNVYIDHGANFAGTLNLFGGADQDLFNKINLLAHCENIVSLDHDMPAWGEQLRKRIGSKSTYEGITNEWCDSITERFSSVKSLKQQDLNTTGIIVGDSHTIAFAHSGDMVLRNDGKTLHGALKDGIDAMFRGATIANRITLCFGSIDIRHHMLRHTDFDLKKYIKEYVDQGLRIQDTYLCDVSYASPVPVEYIDRRIPKTGFYKKTPYFGTWEERRDLTNAFRDELYTISNGKMISPPDIWYSMNPETYAREYMEYGSSFHIAPPYYRKNHWGETAFGT